MNLACMKIAFESRYWIPGQINKLKVLDFKNKQTETYQDLQKKVSNNLQKQQ